MIITNNGNGLTIQNKFSHAVHVDICNTRVITTVHLSTLSFTFKLTLDHHHHRQKKQPARSIVTTLSSLSLLSFSLYLHLWRITREHNTANNSSSNNNNDNKPQQKPLKAFSPKRVPQLSKFSQSSPSSPSAPSLSFSPDSPSPEVSSVSQSPLLCSSSLARF